MICGNFDEFISLEHILINLEKKVFLSIFFVQQVNFTDLLAYRLIG